MSYTHFTLESRSSLHTLFKAGHTWLEIGEQLNKHPVSCWREWKRNRSQTNRGYSYYPSKAHKTYLKRRKTAKEDCCHLENHLQAAEYVEQRLKLLWSPDKIVGRANLVGYKIIGGIKAIYRWIKEKRPDLKRFLKYKGRKKGGCKPGAITYLSTQKVIHDRPPLAWNKEEVGHWEIDTVVGPKYGSKEMVVTATDKATRLCKWNKVQSKDTILVAQMLKQMLRGLPKKTITADNGIEFGPYTLEYNLQTPVYFTDTNAPQQRPQNECFNGYLRKHFPKGTDFATVTDKELQTVEDVQNNTPLKLFGYRFPSEVMREYLSGVRTKKKSVNTD